MRSALLAAVLLVSACAVLNAQTAPAANPAVAETAKADSSIREAMNVQTDAWNRADVDTFMQTYEDSPDTTFIGMTLRKGFKPILERYKQNYTTPEQMGKLSFTDLDIRLLPDACGKYELALVTGKFHLERSARGEAKKDDGIFSLVWRKGPKGWKIILDHTS
jgi:ketosteroid isomerase-like protein